MKYVYLDHRDLIDLTKSRSSGLYEKIIELKSNGNISIILSFMHIIETYKYFDIVEQQKVAELADSLTPIWILKRDYLFTEEICSTFFQWIGIKVERLFDIDRQLSFNFGLIKNDSGDMVYLFSPYRKTAFATFGNYTSDLDKAETPQTYSQILNYLHSNSQIPNMLLQIHDSYPDSISYWRNKIAKTLPGKDNFIKYVISKSLEKYNISAKVIDDYFEWLDIKLCPSLYCYFKVKDEINKDKKSVSHPSEMVDIMHLTALPYCDAFSTDKRIWDYIRRTTLFKNNFQDELTKSMIAYKLLKNIIDDLCVN